MNGFAILMALTVVGVDYGWQPSTDGELEYIIQIEPELLSSLQQGAEINSEIHPDARGVRKFRIRVGKGPLPRNGMLLPGTTPTRLSTSDSPATGSPPDLNPSSLPAYSTNSATRPPGTRPLKLPPPPLQVGVDGKSSVLVRPGSVINSSVSGPPAGSAPSSGNMHLAPPPSRQTTEPIENASNSLGLPHPPSSTANNRSLDSTGATGGSAFPVDASGQPTAPIYPPHSGGQWGNPPPDNRPVRPIIDPAPGFGSPPMPVPGLGQSKIGLPQPPAVDDAAGAGSFVGSAIKPPGSPLKNSAENGGLLALSNGDDTASQKPEIDPATAKQLEKLEAAKPWMPLVLTSLALFASLAANMYLAWIAVGIYRRYREMVGQLHQAQASLT